MIRTTLNWTVKQLKTMHDAKETLSFNHPIQRQAAQWDNEQQSLLIHSILASFPVPNVYLEKREVVDVNDPEKRIYSYSVLDGKQRLTTTFSFANGEFALAEDIDDVTIDGITYSIAGKYFDELPEDVKQEILRFRFTIVAFEDVTDEMIEEIFFRLNNSTPLTKPQMAKPLMGVENSIFTNEILAGRFFREKCSFSKMQLKKSDDMCTLLQAMMLMDAKYREYDYKDISANSVMEYSKFINGNYPAECKDRLKKVIGFLDNCFYMKEKHLKKINIPVVFLMADEALNRGIINSHFRSFFYTFFEESKTEYSQYCSSGSIKKEKTLGRIAVMEEAFEEYFTPAEEETSCDTTDESTVEPIEESSEPEQVMEEAEPVNEEPASNDDSTDGVMLKDIIDFTAISKQIANA